MSLTRAQVESAMAGNGRLKEVLANLKRSGVTDGTNPDLNEPIASALEYFGVLPVDRTAVADSDLANLDDTLQPRFLDMVEIRALEGFVGNASGQKSRVIQFDDYKNDRTNQMQWLLELLKYKQEQFDRRYSQPAAAGSVEMDCGIRHKLHLHYGCRHRTDSHDVNDL